MTDRLGTLCIVLHGHLPYVLNHGTSPHGENWLFEAAAETYLPLLEVIAEVAELGHRAALTIGLTPVLLEQLAHPRFKEGFVEFLNERIARAKADAAEFTTNALPAFATLAANWAKWYADRLAHFKRIDGNIPAEFRRWLEAGQIQVLTSNATHCYMPLVLNDASLRAQMACGTFTSAKHLGTRPRGMWLPECAYRPRWEHWKPSVLYDGERDRPGLETFMTASGVTHFFVESHLMTDAAVMGVFDDDGAFRVTNDAQLQFDADRGWCEPIEPVGVVSGYEPPKVYAFARHPMVSEQVWSGTIGYPGDASYLEFHRKYGDNGLRYHRITSTGTPLSDKAIYEPAQIAGRLYEHAQHFASVVKQTLGEYRSRTGRDGIVVASFDAELFGHWWFEGPRFLREVILALANDSAVDLTTAEEALASAPPDKVMRLPEGSWGENGDHSVWINDRNRLYWEIEYRAESRFLDLLHRLPWKSNASLSELMVRAARELLLLQASDWAFVIHSGGAVDYGTERISLHSVRFHRLCAIAERVASGSKLSKLDKVQIAEVDAHDSIFAEINLDWWMG